LRNLKWYKYKGISLYVRNDKIQTYNKKVLRWNNLEWVDCFTLFAMTSKRVKGERDSSPFVSLRIRNDELLDHVISTITERRNRFVFIKYRIN